LPVEGTYRVALIAHPDVLIAMNEVSLRKFAPGVAPEGLILYNRDSFTRLLVTGVTLRCDISH
jgi:Pyruvate/2-oxoacid:ferredoxin oxidoreductase gamma subunit